MRLLLFSFFAFIMFGCKDCCEDINITDVKQFSCLGAPDNIVEAGVSAPFVGILSDNLIVAGGCSFPDKPLLDGGKKVYSDDIWALDLMSENADWKMVGKLPDVLAYGASVLVDGRLIFIGGNNNECSYSNVYACSFNSAKDSVELVVMDSMPVAMDNFAAFAIENYIYVLGGNVNGVPSNCFYCGVVSDNSVLWKRLPDYLGAARVQPILLGYCDKNDEKLYLSGGFKPGTIDLEPIISSDILAYSVNLSEWSVETELPLLPDGEKRSLTGGNGVFYKDCLIYFGGVNYNCFYSALDRPRALCNAKSRNDYNLVAKLEAESNAYLAHPVEWYNFNNEAICYNLVSKKWKVLCADALFARAGAGIALYNDSMFIVCGETKPGIRTPVISLCKLD